MTDTLFIYLVVINFIAFLVYGIDKYKAIKKKWRIPESTLIALAVVGGGLGAFLAMKAFRHKTQHVKFTVLVPLSLVLWVVGLMFCLL
ncbi:MAG: DUF1294 domain-containing protein [Bacteroidales bacterium]|nr:DUF1294 domain-containing protein [Bacteroidales bacterium]